MAGTKVVLKDFPKGWCSEGKELLLVSLQAQLQVFGPLQGEPWIAPNLSHAEVTFKDPKDAQEAIEVLHGVDFREPEELADETGTNYNGLQVALKQGGNKRGGGAWVDKGQQPPKKEAKVEKPTLGSLGGGLGGGPPAEGVAALAGTWCIHYDAGGGNEMNYTITEEGEVRVGKKRWLQLVQAGSASDTKQDPNYAGTYFLNNAHREDTWEYLWMEGGVLRVHHFTTEDTGSSPYGSPNFWGTGTGQNADQVQQEPKMQQQKMGGQQFAGKKGGGKWSKANAAMAGLEGVWTVVYQGDPNLEAGMTYNITSTGEVTVGKKRHLQLVPAGSPMDTRRDRNYAFDGIFLLDNAHREDTWEYVWLEMGQLCVHHFTEHDKGVSPFGSRHYWGMGMGMQGTLQDLFAPMMGGKGGGPALGGPGAAKKAAGVSYWRQGQSGVQKAAAKTAGWDGSNGNGWKMSGAGGGAGPAVSAPPGQQVGPFEGTWSIEYEPGAGGMTYVISETGEVKIGKKRRAQLVPAQSQWDIKSDANYAGTYFLNEPHREDTWEYMWIEGDTIQVHHFTGDDTGTSPLGSSNYFGAGVGTKKE